MSKNSESPRGHSENTEMQQLLLELFNSSNETESEGWTAFLQSLENNNSIGYCLEQSNAYHKDVKKILDLRGQRNLLIQKVNCKTLLNNYESLTAKISEWNLFRNQVNIDLDYYEKTMDEVTMLSEDVMGVYSKELQTLMANISCAQFSRKPKGPIGSCFSVKGEWKPLVEFIMRPVVFTFLVHNQEDRKILDDLIDNICGWPVDYSQRPAVWVTNFDEPRLELESCSANDPGLLTVMDVMRIHGTDKVVTRFLLENTNMHRILLFKTQHEAFPNLAEKNNLPKGCINAYTLDLFKITPYPSFKSVQLDEDELNFDILGHPFRKTKPASYRKLRICQKSAQELERIIRSMKDIQLNLVSEIMDLKEKISRFSKALAYLKNRPPVQELVLLLEELINSNSKESEKKTVSIQELKDRFTKLVEKTHSDE